MFFGLAKRFCQTELMVMVMTISTHNTTMPLGLRPPYSMPCSREHHSWLQCSTKKGICYLVAAALQLFYKWIMVDSDFQNKTGLTEILAPPLAWLLNHCSTSAAVILLGLTWLPLPKPSNVLLGQTIMYLHPPYSMPCSREQHSSRAPLLTAIGILRGIARSRF